MYISRGSLTDGCFGVNNCVHLRETSQVGVPTLASSSPRVTLFLSIVPSPSSLSILTPGGTQTVHPLGAFRHHRHNRICLHLTFPPNFNCPVNNTFPSSLALTHYHACYTHADYTMSRSSAAVSYDKVLEVERKLTGRDRYWWLR
jgi:hypothetical protein